MPRPYKINKQGRIIILSGSCSFYFPLNDTFYKGNNFIRGTPDMATRLFRLLTVVGMIFLGLLAVVQTLPPRALTASAPADEFSAKRALTHIQALAGEPRPFGSMSFIQARAYVVGELKALGLELGSEEPLAEQALQDPAAGNIVARIPGFATNDAILLAAHLDSTETSPGAADDAAGVAVLLETARALQLGETMPNSVILFFSSQEEQCCLGAADFIDSHPWAKDVRLVVNLDAGGMAGPALLTASSKEDGWLIRQYGAGDSSAAGNSAEQVYGESYDDFTQAFRPAGFPGYSFATYWDQRIHSSYDSVENLSMASVQHLGNHALNLARHFGNNNLAYTPQLNPVYFDVLRLGLVQYPRGLAAPIALVTILLIAWVIGSEMRAKRLKLTGVFKGAMLLTGSVLTAAVFVQIIWLIVSRLVVRNKHFEQQSFVYQIVMEIIFVCAAAAVVLVGRRLMAKRVKLSVDESAAGIITLLAVLGLAVAIAKPGFSYLFGGSLLFTALGLGCHNLNNMKARPLMDVFSGALLVIASAATVLTWTPRIVLDMFDLNMSQSYLIGVWVVLFIGLIMAQFDLLATLGREEKSSIHER